MIFPLLLTTEKWLVNGDFAFPAAAPLPGGVRMTTGDLIKVSDASNTASIASGGLTLGGAACVYRFDPPQGGGLAYRDELAFHFKYTHTSGGFQLGFWSNSTATGNPVWAINPTATLMQMQVGADLIGMETLVGGTEYEIALVLRDDYCAAYIKGGAYTNWRLMFDFDIDPAGTYYCLLSSTDAVVSVSEVGATVNYSFDTAIDILPWFYCKGATTFDPVITTSSGTGTWELGDGTTQVINSLSKIYGVGNRVIKLSGITYANVLTLVAPSDNIYGNPLRHVLQQCPNLTTLDVNTNFITGSIPSLAANTALTTFYCHTNQLTGSLPDFSANTALVDFRCYTNQLTGSIPSLTANTALTTFRCQANQLTGSIPSLSANTALTTFTCDTNQLTGSIPSLSANTALTIFYCNNNQLTGSPVATALHAPAIQDLRFHGNGMSQAVVDAYLDSMWQFRSSYTYATPSAQLGTTNAAPSGVYQAQCPPTTGKEKIYELVNDSCLEGFNNWTITYTA